MRPGFEAFMRGVAHYADALDREQTLEAMGEPPERLAGPTSAAVGSELEALFDAAVRESLEGR